jgi:hypothetical protein
MAEYLVRSKVEWREYWLVSYWVDEMVDESAEWMAPLSEVNKADSTVE